MPYANLEDLPPILKRILPVGAQKIYLKVFNKTWEENVGSELEETHGSTEESSHRMAWAAVKKSYEKKGKHNWKRKKES